MASDSSRSVAEGLRRYGLTNQLLGIPFGGRSGTYHLSIGKCLNSPCKFRTRIKETVYCLDCGHALKWG